MVSNEELIDVHISGLNDTETNEVLADEVLTNEVLADEEITNNIECNEVLADEVLTNDVETYDVESNYTEPMDIPVNEIQQSELTEELNKVNDTESLIIDLLKLSIYNPGEKLSIKLPKNVKDLLGKLMDGENTLFNKIETNLFNIVKDDTINTNDVPDFIIILIVVYETIYNNEKSKMKKDEVADTSGLVIKFILEVLVTENVLKIKDENKEKFLMDINRLVDTCITLVKLSKSVKAPSCLKSLFR